jgi:hypothetical protein
MFMNPFPAPESYPFLGSQASRGTLELKSAQSQGQRTEDYYAPRDEGKSSHAYGSLGQFFAQNGFLAKNQVSLDVPLDSKGPSGEALYDPA